MAEVTIVALPEVEDIVNKVSSETKAHMTLLFLGEVADEKLESIVLHAQHVAGDFRSQWVGVDHRGTLGPESADVVFFDESYGGLRDLKQLRHNLLMNDDIKTAFDAADQFPNWTPHLTLGYPDAPANEIPDERKIHSVWFDRISVWVADSDGPEFRLDKEEPMVDVMHTALGGESFVSKVLMHYGKKGMRWGYTTLSDGSVSVDKSKVAGSKEKGPSGTTVTQTKAGTFARASGGKRESATDDAVKSLATRQKAKASTTDALTNKELQTAITRMQLEQQYRKLEFQSDRRSRGLRFVQGLFNNPRYDGTDEKYKDDAEQRGLYVRDAMQKVLATREEK